MRSGSRFLRTAVSSPGRLDAAGRNSILDIASWRHEPCRLGCRPASGLPPQSSPFASQKRPESQRRPWQQWRPLHASAAKLNRQRQDADARGRKTGPVRLTLLAGVGMALATAALAISQPLPTWGHTASTDASSAIDTPATAGDGRDPALPRFRLADVRKHDAASSAPWVTSGDKVYDITEWVAAHPGGDVILRAAGGSIDPYWNIFTIHKAPHVYEILAQYLIGLIDDADLVDGRPSAESIEDPFASDPVRDASFVTHTAKPCNAEPPRTELVRDFATPNHLFYVRNHMWVPPVEDARAHEHELTVELPDGAVRTYTLQELRRRFRVHRVTAALQCAGNRRSDMTRAVGPTNGLQWGVGAISNAVWEGVLLRDVLADAGLRVAEGRDGRAADAGAGPDAAPLPPADSLHVQLAGMEAYSASIPLPTALDPRGDVLLAFRMNGEPLPRDHGFPLRAVVPGHVAARSVKWLSRIVVADEESASQWQRRDYKLFGPNEGAKPSWDRYPAIQEMPVTSAITNVWVGDACIRRAGQAWCLDRAATPTAPDGDRAAPGVQSPRAWQAAHLDGRPAAETMAVAGYAYAGGGREIVRVDVSVDGGRTWDQAELLDRPGRDAAGGIVARGARDWAWKRWRYGGTLYGGPDGAPCTEIVVKATDSAYNTQPERHDGIYNVRGNLATAWHRVRVCAAPGTPGSDGRPARVWTTDKAALRGCGFEK